MASPCEVHVADPSRKTAQNVVDAVITETRRIEKKYSRYRSDSITCEINTADGSWTAIDAETTSLLEYADKLFNLSNGRFDITSGVLRQVWKFDGSDRVPSQSAIENVRKLIGWQRVQLQTNRIRLEAGMEIDFGGIGKEYAVDRAGLIAQRITPQCMINFGGDLVATGTAVSAHSWHVAVENPAAETSPKTHIELIRGAIATSGDSQRFLLKNGTRYSHILNPLTGWPVVNAARSITVSAATCTLAGMLATFAMLHGADAEAFLDRENVEYWCIR